MLLKFYLRIGEEGDKKMVVGWKYRIAVISFVMVTQGFCNVF